MRSQIYKARSIDFKLLSYVQPIITFVNCISLAGLGKNLSRSFSGPRTTLGRPPIQGRIVGPNIFVNYNLYKVTVSNVEFRHSELVSSSGGLLLNIPFQLYLCRPMRICLLDDHSKYYSCLTHDCLVSCLRLAIHNHYRNLQN
jgi:hypothetical protein